MPTALKRGGKKSLCDFNSSIFFNKSDRQGQHIGVVVLTGKTGQLREPA
jgi:hypothetical protein